jgi:hypothetical protein
MQFLYMGFSQQAGLRCFRFQGVLPTERPANVSSNIELEMSADMALLAQHRVRVQDGPALCLQILSVILAGAPDTAIPFEAYRITEEDVRAFVIERDAIDQANLAKRKSRQPFKPLTPSGTAS